MDLLGVGRLGEQPQGPVLCDHPRWAPATGARDRELGAHRGCDRTRASARAGEVAMLRAALWKLRGLFRRRPDTGFDAELAAHVALLAERYASQGMAPDEAEWAARRQFGNTTLLIEDRKAM